MEWPFILFTIIYYFLLFFSFDIFSEEDPNLSSEEFVTLVQYLVKLFNLLPWLWNNAPGNETTKTWGIASCCHRNSFNKMWQ